MKDGAITTSGHKLSSSQANQLDAINAQFGCRKVFEKKTKGEGKKGKKNKA